MQRYSLTRVEYAKWGILSLVALLDAAVIALTSIQITATPKLIAILVVGNLGSLSIAVYYHRYRNEPHFTHTFVCLLQFCLFTLAGCILTYLSVALRFPLQDENLIAFDRTLGVRVEDLVAWIQRFPALSQSLSSAYDSLPAQFFVLFVYLGIFRGKKEPLDEFVLLMMITLILSTVISGFFPAAGPCEVFDFRVQGWQQVYIDTLDYMRSNSAPMIKLNDLEGMLTFPSFHAVLGCMMIYVFRGDKYTFPVILVLNLTMLISTLTHGCHYLADILAGLLVFALGLLLYKLCFPRSSMDANA